MRLKFGHIARYAEHTGTGLTIVGIFDFLTVPTFPDAPPDRVPLPLFYVAALIGATSFEAGKYPILMRLVDEDGVEGGRMECQDAVFEGNIPGRELGTYLVAPIFGMAVPRYGDYVIEIWGGDNRLGAIDFSVRPPGAPAAPVVA